MTQPLHLCEFSEQPLESSCVSSSSSEHPISSLPPSVFLRQSICPSPSPFAQPGSCLSANVKGAAVPTRHVHLLPDYAYMGSTRGTGVISEWYTEHTFFSVFVRSCFGRVVDQIASVHTSPVYIRPKIGSPWRMEAIDHHGGGLEVASHCHDASCWSGCVKGCPCRVKRKYPSSVHEPEVTLRVCSRAGVGNPTQVFLRQAPRTWADHTHPAPIVFDARQ